MATKNQKKEILTKLKKEINKKGFTDVDKPKSNEIDNFIWIGAQNGSIGNLTCHYEFIFHDGGTLNLEVHFEDENCDGFNNVVEENNNTLEFSEWECDGHYRRIIGRNNNYCIQIDQYTNVDKIVNKAIKLLEKLDKEIGIRLARCVSNLNIQSDLGEDGTIVREREYKNRYVCYPKNYSSKHGEIQEALINQLSNEYNEVGFERPLCDIRVDVLGINKNRTRNKREYTYDIYEVKPYDSPTDCIREALGQLIYYKYKFEKNGYIVGRLIVVGQNDLNPCDIEYLKSIQDSFPIEYKDAY